MSSKSRTIRQHIQHNRLKKARWNAYLNRIHNTEVGRLLHGQTKGAQLPSEQF